MAGAAPTASSSRETTNYARLCRLLVDIGTQVLRDTFNAIHPPANLHAVLAANITALQSLRRRKIINPIQWGKLFPAIPASVSSHTFDTALLMVLLRNLCGLTPPRTRWDALPAVTDHSRAADIARVKCFMDTVSSHAGNASVDDIKFNDLWRDTQDTLVRLGSVRYKAAIDELKNECMDPEVEDHYRKLLSQWKKDEDNIKDQLEEIMRQKQHNVMTKSKEIADKGEISMAIDSNSGLAMCQYHKNEPLQDYCLRCKVCICHICGQIRHDDHTKVDMEQAAKERKVSMAKMLLEAKAEIVTIDSKLNKQNDLRNESKTRIAVAENTETKTVEEVIQVLKDREKMVMEELTKIDETQQKAHEAQIEKFQIFASELKNSVEHCEVIFQKGTAVEILQEEHLQDLLRQCQKMELYKPHDVSYVVNRENVKTLRQSLFQVPLGHVVVSDHSQSAAEGKGLKEAELGAEANFIVITRDSEGKQFYSEQEQVTVTISSPAGEEKVQITDHHDGSYTVHYRPISVGQHDVAIEVNGWPLPGSPWCVNVTPHHYKVVMSRGSRGKKKGEFKNPISISKNELTGNIAVADNHNGRIQLFNKDWKHLRTIGGVKGSQSGAVKIINPRSVAFSKNGDLMVIHGDDQRKMSVITDDGRFIEQFSEYLTNPYSVFVTTDGVGHVIVCDDRKIKVLSSDGAEFLQSFSDPDCHTAPSCVLFHRDMFFVSYMTANCVKVFSKEGAFLHNIGSEDSDGEQFKYPLGLAVDNFDNLIICDNHRLQLFTLDGKFLTSFGQEIRDPWAVTVCKNGDLLVTDVTKHCVVVFR